MYEINIVESFFGGEHLGVLSTLEVLQLFYYFSSSIFPIRGMLFTVQTKVILRSFSYLTPESILLLKLSSEH